MIGVVNNLAWMASLSVGVCCVYEGPSAASSSDKYSFTKSQPAADLSASLISLLRFLMLESSSSR